MRHSKRALAACGALLCCLLLFSACSNIFTTSVASWLARDIDYSSLSLDQLLKLAATRTDSDSAKAILEALAGYSNEELKGLDLDEKEAILEAAINAVFSLDSLLGLTQSLTDGDIDDILSEALDIAESDVDMTAISVILQDEGTLKNASVDTLIFASAALLTTIDEDDIDDVIDAIENGDTDNLTENAEDIAKTIIDVVGALEGRAGEVEALGKSLGIDLGSLIPGYGSSANP